jgi:hypothetical protein
LSELEVGQDLSLVHGQQALDRLDLHEQEVAEHDIEAVAAVESDALIHHGKGSLAFELKAA